MYIKEISATMGLPADCRRHEQSPFTDMEKTKDVGSDDKPEWLEIWLNIAEQDRKFLAG